MAETTQLIGDYRLDAPLGRGATGQVLRAHHIRLQRTAAIKLFDPQITALPDFRQRFTDAMRQAALLQHPHIATIYDLGEHNGRFYIAMELLHGSLRPLIDSAPQGMSLERALEFARQAAEALAYAHTHNVIHGAIKPENMLLFREDQNDGQVPAIKLSDFGIAQLLPAEALSAPPYLAPEQAQDMPADKRSDIYAFGAVLYELVCGAPPFAVRDLAEAVQQHANAVPIAPRMLRAELPSALEKIILRCLEKLPEARFQDANELLLALRPFVSTNNGQGRPRSIGGHVRVELEQEQIALAPGTQAMVPVRLANAGSSPDAYTITVEGVPEGWIGVLDTPIVVEAGEQAAVALLVTPPLATESVVGVYDVVVRAQSLTHATVSGAARMRWRVLPYQAASISITPQQAAGRTEANYEINVRNTGNIGTLFMLSAHDAASALNYAFVQTQVYLAPNQAVAVPLHVTAPERRIGTSKPHPFTIRAKTSTYTQQAAATFTHTAALHPGILAAVAGALLLLVLLGSLLGNSGGTAADVAPTLPTLAPVPTSPPGAPDVARFAVEPREVTAAETVLLSWDVQGADRVVIDQLGDVLPQGQREFRPEKTTDFRLVAWSGNKETVRIERVIVTGPVAEVPVAPPAATPPPQPAPERPPLTLPDISVPSLPSLPPLPEGISLLLQARQGQWSTESGPIRFGRPLWGADAGGWAGRARNVVLEDGQQYAWALCLFPQAQAPGQRFVEGQFSIATIQPGQRFVADVGLAPDAVAEVMFVRISLNDQVVYEGWHKRTGALQPLAIDLSPWAGHTGTLRVRVSAADGAPASGLYWVNSGLN